MAADDVRRVFAYGSLLHEPSLLATLAHRHAPPPSSPFVLDGWRRAWNVVSARTFEPADEVGHRVRRVVLGIEAAPGASCEGVLLDLDDADLAALAPREAAYELVAVGGDGRADVWSFVPKPERAIGVRSVSEPLVIEQAYLDECRSGIATHGLTAAADELARTLTGFPTARAATS